MRIACRSVIIHPENDNRILLVQHHGSDFWSLPGGKIESDESLHQCVIREIQEELGFSCTVDKLIAINEFKYTPESDPTLEFFFACILPSSLNINEIGSKKTGEHFEAELKKCSWVEIDKSTNIKPEFLKACPWKTKNISQEFLNSSTD